MEVCFVVLVFQTESILKYHSASNSVAQVGQLIRQHVSATKVMGVNPEKSIMIKSVCYLYVPFVK